jgi:hypothetical protein
MTKLTPEQIEQKLLTTRILERNLDALSQLYSVGPLHELMIFDTRKAIRSAIATLNLETHGCPF